MQRAKDKNVEVPAGKLKLAVHLSDYSVFHVETVNCIHAIWSILFSEHQVLRCLGNQSTGSLNFEKMQAWKLRAKNMLGVSILKRGACIPIARISILQITIT